VKIFHAITGLPKSAGTSVFVGELANELVSRGNEVSIVVIYPEDVNRYPIDNRIKLISFDELQQLSDLPDVIHLHGLWEWPIHRACHWAVRNHVPIIWSPHGALSPWSLHHKWWKKCVPWYLYQRHDLTCARIIHATTELEARWNKRFGFAGKPLLVPLGVHLPQMVHQRIRMANEPLRVLFVGRIYPVKGLLNVVRAAEKLKDISICFRIVGPDQAGHQSELITETERLGVSSMFEWPGAKFGEELADEYDACDILILPSFTENFGATVAEALAHGRPALASRFTPWRILDERKCGWWVDNEPSTLAETLRAVALLDAETLTTMGTGHIATARNRKYFSRVILSRKYPEWYFPILVPFVRIIPGNGGGGSI